MQQRLVFTCGAGLGLAVGLLVGFLPEPAQPVLVPVAASVPTAEMAPGKDATVIKSGTWRVGDEILPGTYASDGDPNPEHACEWERLEPDLETPIQSGTGSPGDRELVIIQPGDGAFRSTQCGTWTRIR